MTHMHFDHTSGMSEFPGATFVITEDEWIAAANDSRPFLRGYRPEHFDYAFDYRTLSYDSDAISSYANLRPHLRPLRRRQRPARLDARATAPATSR